MQGVLITAYKDTNQLNSLLDILQNNCKIYIHIDKKSEELDETTIKERYPSINVIKKYKINWGGVNHLKAILELCQMAVLDQDITYLHIISGQDYPVKSMEEFREQFEHSQNIYMTCISENQFPDVIKDRLSYYVINGNWDSRKKVVYIINKLSQIFQKILKKTRNSLGEFTRIYKGMVWVSMPRDVAFYVLDYINTHPEFMKDLEHTVVAEEFFFQTLLANSIHKSKIVPDNLRYTDWNIRYKSIPAYLDETDYNKIIASNAFFARKVQYDISRDLVLKLRKHINYSFDINNI